MISAVILFFRTRFGHLNENDEVADDSLRLTCDIIQCTINPEFKISSAKDRREVGTMSLARVCEVEVQRNLEVQIQTIDSEKTCKEVPFVLSKEYELNEEEIAKAIRERKQSQIIFSRGMIRR